MENDPTPATNPTADSSTVYVIGAVIVVAAVVAGVMLWPKPKPATETPAPQASQPKVEQKTGYSQFGCEKQWFNPRIGFQQYYLSAEGGDVTAPASVDCTITVLEGDKVIATEKVAATMAPAPERGGTTIRCTSGAVTLPKGKPFTMKTVMTNDRGQSVNCTPGAITLP